jgi:hypothetical protein
MGKENILQKMEEYI